MNNGMIILGDKNMDPRQGLENGMKKANGHSVFGEFQVRKIIVQNPEAKISFVLEKFQDFKSAKIGPY